MLCFSYYNDESICGGIKSAIVIAGLLIFKHIKFKINGSIIELKCTKCMSLIGWWQTQTEKIMPLKRSWSEAECMATR